MSNAYRLFFINNKLQQNECSIIIIIKSGKRRVFPIRNSITHSSEVSYRKLDFRFFPLNLTLAKIIIFFTVYLLFFFPIYIFFV